MEINGKEYTFKSGVTLGYVDKVVDFERENRLFDKLMSASIDREERAKLWGEYCGMIFEGDFPPLTELTYDQLLTEIPAGFFSAQVSGAKKPSA